MKDTGIKNQDLDTCLDLIAKNRTDMQGLITHGYPTLPAARFLLLRIIDPQLSRSFLSAIQTRITNAYQSQLLSEQDIGDTALQIAFTSSGLVQLNLPSDVLASFPREFLEGMSYSYLDPKKTEIRIRERSTLLGDVGINAPENWYWGNADNPIDCMLLLYAKTPALLDQLTSDVYPGSSTGMNMVWTANTYPYKDSNDIREHFGFRDGISQPIIKGLPKSVKKIDSAHLLNPGEFILGYKNEYQSYSPRPFIKNYKGLKVLHSIDGKEDIKDLGKNGSFLVFRQMEQHVERFWNYMFNNSMENAPTPIEKAIKLASKMVGRWPDGQPLATDHDQPQPHPVDELNKFDYSEPDKHGIGCPFGAHIRRTNPRDMVHAGRGPELSLQMSNKHRMLRRGRIYGHPLHESFNIPAMVDIAKSYQAEKGVQ
ncbi:MAG: hypothetical protein EOP48_24130, partial [Sphingobacteriales bacterium]